MPSRRHLLASGVALAGAGVGFGPGSGSTGDTRLLPARTRSAPPSATAEWPMARYDAAGTGYAPAAAGPKDGVEPAWTASLERTGGFEIAPPVLVDGTVYAGTDELVAVDAATGDVRFSYGTWYGSSPARASTSIYRTDTLAVSSPDGVVGLNAGGGLSVGPIESRFGAERWRGPRQSADSFFGPPATPPPVAVDGTVYATLSSSDEIVALEADSGRVRWRREFHPDGWGGTSFRPAVRDGTVFAVGWPSTVAAFDAATGSVQWRESFDAVEVNRPITAAADAVVVPPRNGVVVLEADGGAVRWERDLEGNATAGAAAVAEGTVYVADNGGEGSLHAFDLETGETEWSAQFSGEASPVVADGTVYATDGYDLLAFDAETGAERFAYEAERYLSPPAVGDGVLYVVDGDRVLALEESE